jgi:splicing factor U2AF 65 kDa subunit
MPVKVILSKYGLLKSFHLVKDQGEILSRGYAFCEYQDQESTNEAMKLLNGHLIEGKPLILKLAGSPVPLDTKSTDRPTYD